jgi:hypothetical protein
MLEKSLAVPKIFRLSGSARRLPEGWPAEGKRDARGETRIRLGWQLQGRAWAASFKNFVPRLLWAQPKGEVAPLLSIARPELTKTARPVVPAAELRP